MIPLPLAFLCLDNSLLVRKTLVFSKELTLRRAAATWNNYYYNLISPHKSLRQPIEDAPHASVD